MKRIKLMPDYYCFPIWDLTPDAYGDVDPKMLPISKVLQDQLMEWASSFDETLDRDDPATSGFLSLQAASAFREQGAKLAESLQQELGTDYAVEVHIDVGVREPRR